MVQPVAGLVVTCTPSSKAMTPTMGVHLDPGPSVTIVMVIIDDASLQSQGLSLGGGHLLVSSRPDGEIAEVPQPVSSFTIS